MALVDHERAWLKLKAYVATKGSHGKRDLFLVMSEIEVECTLDEDLIDPRPVAVVGSTQLRGV